MGPVKRVLLGSAAGVFAVAGAQAADLPVKAKPVEYVKVCSLYGAGFWYVPGTDTCIKIGAFVKLQTVYHANTGGPFMMGAAANGGGDTSGQQTRTGTSQFGFNNRAAVSFDMRTQTEYGTLRSYFDAFFQTQSSASAAQLSSISLGNTRAFIQFAGFTAGRMRSFFDLYFQGTYALAGGRFAADTAPNGIIGAAYTWQFGGGLSGSLSLEDNGQGNSGRGRSTINASAAALGVGTNTFDNKGQEFFDPVGDTIAAQAVYSKGAAGYATSAWGPTAVFGSGLNLGVGWLEEGVFTTGHNVELTTVWSFNGAYEHRWNPQWRTSIHGGMFGVEYDGAAAAAICASPATSIAIRGVGCSPNFSMSGLGSRTMWNPVPDLDVGFDVVWWHLNTAFNGGLATLTATGAKPASANYTISNQDAVTAIFRVQRNFLY